MLDMYALPITLRYKNQKMFYTNYGAVISLLVYLAIAVTMGNELLAVFNPSRTSILIKSWSEAASYNNTINTSLPEAPHYIIGWRLRKGDKTVKSDPSTVTVKLMRETFSVREDGELITRRVQMETESCLN